MKSTQLKSVTLFIIFFLFSILFYAQEIVKTFHQGTISTENIVYLKSEFGNFKNIPKEFEEQVLIALSYFPELKNIHIKFRLKNRLTPLATKPNLISVFKNAKKRIYIITVSTKSTSYLDTIIFKNLNYNAQIGVLGHELSHVSSYLNNDFSKMWNIFWIEIFSKKKVNDFEYNTDLNCINHGLGYQLLDWSINVRKNLGRVNWLGAVNLTADTKSERYMNPSTIIKILNNHPLYQED
ncbi:MAG: hypothetical protein QM495_00805 [Lutibacter sp.]|uniref:hypothetical protein n=1 Tax=Lutibacter sp. TaxID=1925666 RepID=UPI003859A37C